MSTPRMVPLACCNVLYEVFYRKYNKNPVVLPLPARTALFDSCAQQGFRPAAAVRADDPSAAIVCFQEFPDDDDAWRQWYRDYDVIASHPRECSVVLGVKKNSGFSIAASAVNKYGRDRGKAAVWAAVRDATTRRLTLVVTAHLPWKGNRAEQVAMLRSVLPLTSAAGPGAGDAPTRIEDVFDGVFVCGDFNMPWNVLNDALAPEAGAEASSLPRRVSGTGWRNLFANVPFTSMDAGCRTATRIDHGWYLPLGPVETSSEEKASTAFFAPEDPRWFVFHEGPRPLEGGPPPDVADPARHFSDHSLLYCTVPVRATDAVTASPTLEDAVVESFLQKLSQDTFSTAMAVSAFPAPRLA